MSVTVFATLARTTAPQIALRRFLALDAIVTTANALAYVAFAGPLGELFGVGRTTVLVLGVLLTLYGAAVGLLASRREPPAFPVTCVVEANYAWVVLSLVSLFAWFSPTTAGAVWIAAQALTVAAFAVLQQLALRSRGSEAQ
ncbi:hypothetical protein [Streptomyces xanthophaeus]|uniref:hypothetical protein n=1 Tax=Streptomyces xanthophaeus TaxID=67385 RepID=UPI0036584DCF